ncbi:MAG TPA: HAMP domain-containing sensor histidine kinase [Polyangiaceae bacterium]|nr:HAMP domain-containing sensor histidine kinase [Polyangiaceae bacterium]
MKKLFSGQRLLSRIFLHGLVVLVASAVTLGLVSALVLRQRPEGHSRSLGKWLVPELCDKLATAAPEAEQGLAASLYSRQGELKGTLVKPALPALEPEQSRALLAGQPLSIGRTHAFTCPAGAGGDYVLIRLGPPPPPNPVTGLALPFLIVIIVVAVASLPFARSISAPIERIVGVTRAFGSGDLAARAEARRRDEVGDLARAFNEMAERLQHSIRAEQELLANVSHELRTPLARIRVVLETAQDSPERSQNLLGEIAKDLVDLERLVENVMEAMRLDLRGSSLSGRQMPARFEATDVAGLTRVATARFCDLNPERSLKFESTDAPSEVEADPRLLRRLLDNLLQNADKYSDRHSPILVRVMAEANGVLVEVTDHGVGIDADDLPHVFEPFFRSDRSRSRGTGGAGLGLALAKRIVELHRGSIEIQSKPGQGTTVQVRLGQAAS